MPKNTGKTVRNFEKPHYKIVKGHVELRLLCSVQAGYAVIGRGGAVCTTITRETGISIINVEDPLPGCDERVVHVIGPSNIERSLVLRDYGGERKFEVSPVQDALIRVLKILESVEGGLKCCRLLAAKGKEKIKSLLSLGNVVGASVRVLPVEDHPLCAENSDDLIQISGDALAVRKALLAVTFCLQGNMSTAISQFRDAAPSGVSRDLYAQKHTNLVTEPTEVRDRGQSHMDVGTKEVAFKLLCPIDVAGGLIGWKGSIVKTLEKETGACIKVSDPLVGCTERVIKVFAMEKKEWQNSPAQNATLVVFNRMTEVALESEHVLGSSRGDSVTVRLLISSSEASMFDMKDTAGTEVQILASHCSPIASVDEKVMQIVGDFSDVHICLLQVTWTLRESVFATNKKKLRLPHEICVRPPYVNAATTIEDDMNNINISYDTNKSTPSVLSSEASFGRTRTYMETQGDIMASSSGSELGSGDECNIIKNDEVEIIIPAHIFDHVYGEGGGNLAILRQISGAKVIVHDPSPGVDGKVIICGTPNQIMAAKSMLYAFIMRNHNDCVVMK